MSFRETLRDLVTFSPSPIPASYDAVSALEPDETYASAGVMVPGLSWQTTRPTWPTWDPYKGGNAYAKLALIYRCVNIIAHAIGTAPVRVLDETRDNEAVDDHPMRTLMKRPNPLMGEAAFWSHVAVRSACSGFCLVEKERARSGEPIALWPLQSAWLKAIQRRDGRVDWEYRVPGIVDPFPLPAEDVINFRWADTPSGSPYGLGPLEACFREVALSNAMTDFLKAFFERGAVPLFALIPEPDAKRLNQPEVEALLDSFVTRRLGLANAARPLFLQAIKDIKRIGFDFNELAYSDLRDLSELGIIQAFGIPASVAQIRVGLEHSDSRANAEVDELKLYRQTIIPLWARFDDALTLGLLDEYPDADRLSLEFDISKLAVLQENRNEKAVWIGTGVNGGWLSVHTAHRELGLPLPDGDDYYLRPLAVEAIPVTDPIPEPELLPELPEPPPVVALPPEAGLARRSATTTATGASYRFAGAGNGRRRIVRVAELRTPSLVSFFRAQGERVIPKVIARLDGRGPDATYDGETGGVDWANETERLRVVLDRLWNLAGNTAFAGIKTDYGVDAGIAWDVANPHVAAIVDSLGLRVRAITESTRRDIAAKIASGLSSGFSVAELRDSLAGLFTETYRGRSETIARTESMLAYGHASTLGFRESGVVDRIQCFDNHTHTESYGASDGLTCAQRDGFISPLDASEKHLVAEHPNGSLVVTPILISEPDALSPYPDPVALPPPLITSPVVKPTKPVAPPPLPTPQTRDEQIAAIEQELLDGGISAIFGDHLEIAQAAQTAVQTMKAAGGEWSGEIAYSDKAPSNHATYSPAKNLLSLNLNWPGWFDEAVARSGFYSGFFSTGSSEGTILHELGHALHWKEIRSDSNWSKIWNGKFSVKERNIAARVSKYAATQPAELIAEVYTGVRTLGITYDADVLALYRKYKGPPL